MNVHTAILTRHYSITQEMCTQQTSNLSEFHNSWRHSFISFFIHVHVYKNSTIELSLASAQDIPNCGYVIVHTQIVRSQYYNDLGVSASG